MTSSDREVRGYVRVTTLRVRPEAARLALDRFFAMSAPLVTRLPGAIGIVSGGSLETGSGIAFSFWESLEALERSSGDPQLVDALAGYASWMAGPFAVESYTLVRGTPLVDSSDQERAARILSVVTDPGDVDLALDAFDAWLARSEASPDCVTALLLKPLMGTRVIGVEV